MNNLRARTPIMEVTTSAVRTTLYTCPPNARARVPLVYIVNANGNVVVKYEIYKKVFDQHFLIVQGKNLALGETIKLGEGYIVLDPGDKLVFTCTGTTPKVDILATVEETFVQVGYYDNLLGGT